MSNEGLKKMKQKLDEGDVDEVTEEWDEIISDDEEYQAEDVQELIANMMTRGPLEEMAELYKEDEKKFETQLEEMGTEMAERFSLLFQIAFSKQFIVGVLEEKDLL